MDLSWIIMFAEIVRLLTQQNARPLSSTSHRVGPQSSLSPAFSAGEFFTRISKAGRANDTE